MVGVKGCAEDDGVHAPHRAYDDPRLVDHPFACFVPEGDLLERLLLARKLENIFPLVHCARPSESRVYSTRKGKLRKASLTSGTQEVFQRNPPGSLVVRRFWQACDDVGKSLAALKDSRGSDDQGGGIRCSWYRNNERCQLLTFTPAPLPGNALLGISNVQPYTGSCFKFRSRKNSAMMATTLASLPGSTTAERPTGLWTC